MPDRPISSKIAGSTRMKRDVFDRALGRAGERVWDLLCGLRDERGVVELSVEEIASAGSLATKYVRNGLARLAEVGLVTTAGPAASGSGRRRRIVYGTRSEFVDGEGVVVPSRVWRALRASTGHGGQRKCADGKANPVKQVGPKKGRQTRKQVGPQTGPQTGARASGATNRASGATKRASGATKLAAVEASNGAENGAAKVEKSNEVAALEDGSSRVPARARPRARAHGIYTTPEGGSYLLPSEEDAAARQVAAEGTSVSREEGGGLRAALGAFSAPSVHPRLLDGVPRFPGFDVVTPAITPHPPKLEAAWSERERLEYLAAIWASAYEVWFQKTCWTFRGRGRDVHRSKHRAVLLAASEKFIEHDIAPAAWVGFSLDVWADKQGDGKPPPIAWVFAASRIEQRRGWFRREGVDDYRGGLVVKTPAFTELQRRYAAMTSALLRLHPTEGNRGRVAEVVERFFPGALYDDLVQRAREEASEKQRRLRAMARRGEWLWGVWR